MSLALVPLVMLGSLVAWTGLPLLMNANWGGDDDEKLVALSFDDGPYAPYTAWLLDVLEREQVRATFFMSGANLERDMELGRRVVESGHEVGNHGWDGTYLPFASPFLVRMQLDQADALLEEIGVEEPIGFRPARGMAGPFGAFWVWRRDRRQIMGTVAGYDWVRPTWSSGDCPLPVKSWCPTQDPESIAQSVLDGVEPGAIVVLHDGYDGGPGADRSGTVAAVEFLIPRLRKRGYRIVPVGELLESGGGEGD